MPNKKTVLIVLCCITVLIFCLMMIGQGVTGAEVTLRDENGETVWTYVSRDREECTELINAINAEKLEPRKATDVRLEGTIRVTFSFLMKSSSDFTLGSAADGGKMVFRTGDSEYVMPDGTKEVFLRFIEKHTEKEE